MTTCRTCKHWDATESQRTSGLFPASCPVLRKLLTIDIDQGNGWGAGGASLDDIETPHDFGCNQYAPILQGDAQ